MMAPDQHHKLKEELAPLLRVLKQFGGKMVFRDDEGDEFMIASRDEIESMQAEAGEYETQLSFPAANAVSDAVRKNVPGDIGEDVLERINRDIALAAEAEHDDFQQPLVEAESAEAVQPARAYEQQPQQEFEQEAALSPADEGEGWSGPRPPEPPAPAERQQEAPSDEPVRVKFESVSGDLPPELQE